MFARVSYAGKYCQTGSILALFWSVVGTAVATVAVVVVVVHYIGTTDRSSHSEKYDGRYAYSRSNKGSGSLSNMCTVLREFYTRAPFVYTACVKYQQSRSWYFHITKRYHDQSDNNPPPPRRKAAALQCIVTT